MKRLITFLKGIFEDKRPNRLFEGKLTEAQVKDELTGNYNARQWLYQQLREEKTDEGKREWVGYIQELEAQHYEYKTFLNGK